MRWHCISGYVLLVSFTVVGVMQRPANAQPEPTSSTIRLASASQPSGSIDREPPSQPWPQRSSELAFEQLPAAASGSTSRSSASVNASSPGNSGVQQAGYVESPATRPLADVPNNNRSRSLAGVYPSSSAQATLNKLPRPAPVQPVAATPVAQASRLKGKPFQAIQSDPALSPYLNLYRTNLNPNTMPNYFALVRPQFDQQEQNRKHAAEIQQLQRQLQNSQSTAASTPYSASSSNGMSASARYMETGQFYKHTRR